MKKKNSVGKVLLMSVVVFAIFFWFNILMNMGTKGLEMFTNFFDLPALILILLLVVPMLVVSGSGRDFLNVFSIGKKEYPIRSLKRSLEAVQLVQKLILYSSMISCIIAFVTILTCLEDTATLGPCLAVALLIVFYAAILELFLIPVKAKVQNAITDLMDVEDEEA